MEHLQFLHTAMRDRNVGAVAPTTFLGVREACRGLPTDRPITVVEYGPGTGCFTRYFQRRLHPDSTIVAIELNQQFAEQLRKAEQSRNSHRRPPRFAPRLEVVSGDCRDVKNHLSERGLSNADVIVSGIPFSFLEPDVKRQIVRNSFEALGEEGRMIVYQYSFHMRPYLKEAFSQVRLRRVLFNLPPLCIMEASKTVAPVKPRFGWPLRRMGSRMSVLV